MAEELSSGAAHAKPAFEQSAKMYIPHAAPFAHLLAVRVCVQPIADHGTAGQCLQAILVYAGLKHDIKTAAKPQVPAHFCPVHVQL